MRIVAAILALFLLVVVLLVGVRTRLATFQDPDPTPPMASEYLGLRKLALEITPAEAGLSAEVAAKPWAMIMEMDMGSSNATVTVFSVIDGTASIYLSTGGGHIGGEGRPKIRDAAIAFVKTGAEFRSHMIAVKGFAFPKAGETLFYLREADQILTVSARTSDLESGHRLTPLYAAGQEVITQFRLDSEGGR